MASASEPSPLPCPRCRQPWRDPAVSQCPNCGFALVSYIFPAAHRSGHESTVTSPSPAQASEAVCHAHPQRRASLACDQCGRLMCGLCDVPAGLRHLCPTCFDSAQTRVDGDLPASRTLHGRIALTLSILPLFPPTALAALIVLAVGRGKPGSLVRPSRTEGRLALIIASLQLLGFALLIAAIVTDR